MAYTDPVPDRNNGDVPDEDWIQILIDNDAYHFRPPICIVTHDASQTPGSGAALAFNSEIFDPDGMHDPATNNTRITVPVDGIYQAIIAADVGSDGWLSLYLNGTTKVGEGEAPGTGSSYANTIAFRPVVLSAGDYLEIWDSSGVGAIPYVASLNPIFSVHWLRGPA